ncbi:hypothetical protein Vretimale_1407 [Volvox reticuliferus]|uniref:Uncharacterized protein n=1 Tax=Volvox reticuliferus TaxID=1737510 RepID=A0A8J4CIP9_9CHLO|nr:hypothetical protein Vretifemale_10802 [Volvox reticuliferus]GIL95363.1 hypothetical protein Vretimale_1407 [Volvox reticuliferus]
MSDSDHAVQPPKARPCGDVDDCQQHVDKAAAGPPDRSPGGAAPGTAVEEAPGTSSGPQAQQQQLLEQGQASEEREPSGSHDELTRDSGSGAQQVDKAQVHEEDLTEQEASEVDVKESAAKDAEALARAEALKREGNELFGKALWNEAMTKYNEALDAAPRSAAKEQAIYFANLAACNIKTQQYAYAVQNCTEAIRLDGSYSKAYMRRCEAFERLDELDHALSDAKALLAAEPENAWAKAKVEVLQPKVDERTEKLKSEMFSKLKDLGNTVLGKFGLSLDNFKFDKDPNTGGYSVRFER